MSSSCGSWRWWHRDPVVARRGFAKAGVHPSEHPERCVSPRLASRWLRGVLVREACALRGGRLKREPPLRRPRQAPQVQLLRRRRVLPVQVPAHLGVQPHAPANGFLPHRDGAHRAAVWLVERLRTLLSRQPLDNNNINVHATGRRVYATCDGSASTLFDLGTLRAARAPRPCACASRRRTRRGPSTGTRSTTCATVDARAAPVPGRRGHGRARLLRARQLRHLPLMHSFAVTSTTWCCSWPLRMDAAAWRGASAAVEMMRWTGRDVVAFVFDLSAGPEASPRCSSDCPLLQHALHQRVRGWRERLGRDAHDRPDRMRGRGSSTAT